MVQLHRPGRVVPVLIAQSRDEQRRHLPHAADMYANGEGVPKDAAEAVRWYRLAAEQGNAIAQSNLGFRYANGEGVPEDDVTAYAWLNIAAAQGQSRANKGKELVARHMTQSQVAKAQKLSREYWTRYVIPFQ